MSLTTNGKNYIAQKFGLSNCFVSTGLSWTAVATDGSQVNETGGTASIIGRLVTTSVYAKIILNSVSYYYTDMKAANDNTDLTLVDAQWVAANDGSPTSEAQYCYTAPTTGVLSFSSTPSGAEIYIDDVDQLKTTTSSPVNISVSATTHTWKLTLSGYNNATGSQLVTAGQTYTINPTLTPSTGSINFVSSPTGANIKLDGVNTGFVTDKLIGNVSTGTHLYILTKDGYKDKSGQVDVSVSITSNVSVTLEPLITNEKITLNDSLSNYNCYGFVIPKETYDCSQETRKVYAIYSTGDCSNIPSTNYFIWYRWSTIQLTWEQYIQTPPISTFVGFCNTEAILPCGYMYKVMYGTTEKTFTIQSSVPSSTSPIAMLTLGIIALGVILSAVKK